MSAVCHLTCLLLVLHVGLFPVILFSSRIAVFVVEINKNKLDCLKWLIFAEICVALQNVAKCFTCDYMQVNRRHGLKMKVLTSVMLPVLILLCSPF